MQQQKILCKHNLTFINDSILRINNNLKEE